MDILWISSKNSTHLNGILSKSVGKLCFHRIDNQPFGEIIQHLSNGNIKAVLLDACEIQNCKELIDLIAQRFSDLPVVAITLAELETEIQSLLGQGLWDYLLLEDLTVEKIHKTLIICHSWIPKVKQLEKMEDEIHEAKEYSNRLLTRMSHEIRTPLNAIIGMTEMLFDTHLNSKQRFYTDTIHESGTLLVALFNDLLDYSKIEAGTIRIHNKPFNLRDAMRECLVSVMEEAMEKRLELLHFFDPQLPQMFMGDDLRIRQIVMNLLDNAIKYTPQGFVRFEVTQCFDQQNPLLCIKVADSGPGIKEDILPQLFKPYVQAPTDSSNKRGVGLGLTICDHLVKQMNGNIEVETQPGKGTTFIIHLPCHHVEGSSGMTPIPLLKNKKVLYLTTDPILDDLISKYLIFNEMDLHIQHIEQDNLAFLDRLPEYDLLISHLRTNLKIDLRFIDAVREKHPLPHLLLKEREKINDKPIVIRKDTVIFLKPLDYNELYEGMEVILNGKADDLNTIERQIQMDERMGEYHPLDILVVEDNAINQRIIMGVLNRYGYQVKLAENGKEAIESLERRVYDVVLMDIQMPVMDGLTATKLIRERLHAERQPHIVALTADVLQQSKSKYLSQGIDELLYKPVQTKALMQILSKCKRLERGRWKN